MPDLEQALLSRRSMLALVAVVDIAMNGITSPVSAKSLASRHKLAPRHLEVILQSLVHSKVINGTRGPKGGYSVARDRSKISVIEIVNVAVSLSIAESDKYILNSVLFNGVINPFIHDAARDFIKNLGAMTIDDLCKKADALGFSQLNPENNFTI